MRKAIFGLGFFLLIACGGESGTPDSGSGSAAASGEDANGGSTSNGGGGPSTGGSADTGGSSTGGTTTAGGSPSGGSSEGGSTASGGSGGGGTDGESGEGGVSGDTGGMATSGSTGQSGGNGGSGGKTPTDAVCDPALGELKATPYPDCEPRDANDPCELCIQAECCTESKTCYGYEPGNVCGWGGPTTGSYAGLSEIDCYVACVRDYVNEFGAYDDTTDNACIPACTTAGCGLIGNATQDLVVCMRAHCDDECFLP